MLTPIDNPRFEGIDPNLKNKISIIYELYNEFIKKIDKNYATHIRFQDYYNFENDVMGNIEFFKYYFSENNDLLFFIKHIVERLVGDLFYILKDEEFGLEDLIEIIDNQDILDEAINALNYAMDLLKDKNETKSEIEFLNPDNPFKIMFTKMAHDDIISLPENALDALIKMLYSPLSTDALVKQAYQLERIRGKKDINFFRIHLTHKYRIVYYRNGNITTVLGISFKTGNPYDYDRYFTFANNQDILLQEIEMFRKGIKTKEHEETIEFIKETYNNSKQR